MAFDVDAAANALVGLRVNTYFDTPDDAVTPKVGSGTTDGASYNQQITLEAKAKNITVVVQELRPSSRWRSSRGESKGEPSADAAAS